MKKLLLAFVVFCAPVWLQAGVEEAVTQASFVAKKNQILLLFNLAAENASACRQAVASGRWNAAVAAGQQALDYQHQAESLAQGSHIVLYGEDSVLNALAANPLPALQATQENILFSRVISGKISLQQALEEGRIYQQNKGLVGAILNGNEEVADEYRAISRAFRLWKGCRRSIRSLGEDSVVHARAFCRAD